MYFTQIELLLIIIITATVFYIIYHMANCPVYKYSNSKKIIPIAHITAEAVPLAPHVDIPLASHVDIPLINQETKQSICDMGRPRCDIYQSNTENYSKCYDDLINYIDNGCNKNQFSFENNN